MSRLPLVLSAFLVVGPAFGAHDHVDQPPPKSEDAVQESAVTAPRAPPSPAVDERWFRALLQKARESGQAASLEQWDQAHGQLDRFLRGAPRSSNPKVAVFTQNVLKTVEFYDARLHQRAREGKPLPPDVLGGLSLLAGKLRSVAEAAIDMGEADYALENGRGRLSRQEHAALQAKKREADRRIDLALEEAGSMHGVLHSALRPALLGLGWNEMGAETRRPVPGGPERTHRQRMAELDDPYAQVVVGRGELEEKEFAAAERSFAKALRADPQNVDALVGRGAARYELRDYPGAVQDARAALSIEPDNPAARNLHHLAIGRTGIALAAPKPENPWDQAASAKLAGGGSRDSAGAEAGGSGSSHLREYETKRKMGDHAAARLALDRALAENPANLEAHARRAGLNVSEGRLGDAIGDVRTILRLDPRQGAAVATNLARQLSGRGHYREAKDLLGLIPPEGRDAKAWFALAQAEYGLGDRDAMLGALRRAADLDPRYRAKYERARDAGDGADLAALFDEAAGAATAKDVSTSGGERGGGSLLRTILLTLVGGFLVALGLMHIVTAQWSRRWTTRVTSAFAAAPGPAEILAGEAPAPQPAPGQRRRVGNYEILRQIGLGGMGIVYEAVDRSLNRRVAVKKMREEIRVDPHERERFLKEARTVAALRHPGIVEIHAVVEDGTDIYLVFEYVEGATLYELLDRRGPLPLAEASRIVEEAGKALDYAHKRGVIHRDLKPSNIMIEQEGGGVKVMDFGVARQAKDAVSKLSMTSTVVGTPPYMAPEQEQGLVCRESDVYALGVCFYELLTGRMPFQGTGAGMLLNKMNKAYAPPTTLAPSLPPAVDPLMAKALEPEPARRYRNVEEFLAAVRSLAARPL
ncbi:MAG: protein kinase [Elusimicrobia bacterium]|nr:protein kinase [Elusimicrobiota bacterium]